MTSNDYLALKGDKVKSISNIYN